MDLKEILGNIEELNMVVVSIHHLSKLVVTDPYKKIVYTEDSAKIDFIHHFRRLGIPGSAISDLGAQYVSQSLKYFCKLLKV